MQRAVAEKIIQAAKELDQAFGQIDSAVHAVEDEEERHRMHRVLIGSYADLLHHVTRSCLSSSRIYIRIHLPTSGPTETSSPDCLSGGSMQDLG